MKYFKKFNQELDPELLEIAGTAIVFDTTKQKLKTIAGDIYNITDYPQDIYEPVGVVIMPASHTEDGVARMMSTKLMGVKTSDDGSVTYGAYDASNASEYDMGIAWANPDADNVNNLIEYVTNNYGNNPLIYSSMTDKQPSCDDNPYEVTGDYGFYLYTNINNITMFGTFNEDTNNPGNGWYSSSQRMPSPYLANGTPNIAMRVTGTTMGITHGSVVSDIVNEYSNNSGERFDIFNAANVYSTNGTSSGEWYVPSPLEIAYIAAKMKEIRSIMNKLNPNFDEYFDGILGLGAEEDGNLFVTWASTLFSSSYAWFSNLPFHVADYFVGNDHYGSFGFVVCPVCN